MTLAETVKTFRTGTRVIVLCAGLLLFGRIAMAVTGSAFPGRQPTPTPTPPAGFGQLPAVQIDSLALDSSTSPTAVQDLISAVFPETPQTMPVYQIAEPASLLLMEEKARAIAGRFSLKGAPDITDIGYIWRDKLQYLAVDKTTLNIDYRYDYYNKPELFTPGVFFSTSKITSIGRKILENKNLDYGLEDSRPTFQLLKYQNGVLRQATSLRDTAAARVDFPLPAIGEYPVVEQDPAKAQISVIFTGNLKDRDTYGTILELSNIRWSVLSGKPSSYPVKSAAAAWEEFSRSQQFLVQVLPRGQDPTLPYSPQRIKEFRAREAYLAYFNPPTKQSYFQPVWVLKGTATLFSLQQADWQAYVPAIPEEWIKE